MVGGVLLLSFGSYEGVLQKALTAVKSQGHQAAGKELARQAADVWLPQIQADSRSPRLHPIAPSTAGQKLRGFSLTKLLAQELQRRSGWTMLEEGFASSFPSDSGRSRGMGIAERWNRRRLSEQSESVSRAGSGALILIDDVVTTGATMSATANVAKEMGFAPVIGLALSSAPSL